MVRYLKHIALFLSLALIAGCNPGITDNPPAVIMNVQDYFWKSASNSSLFYEYFKVSDSSRKEYEYSFQHLAGTNGTMSVSELPTPNAHTFYYKFDTAGSVLAGGLSYRTLFPLPDGYEVSSNTTTYDTAYESIGTKKVLALGEGKAVAIGDDENIYYTTTAGATWQMSEYIKSNGSITAWTKIQIDKKFIIYAGTSSGSLVKSVDGGTTWSLVKYFSNTNITSIAVLSSGHIFIASGSKTIIDYDENKDSIVKYAHAYSITSVAVCEAGSDSGGVNHPTLIVGTEMGGLYVWEYGPSQSFINSTNGQKAYSTIKLVATGKKSALALAKSKSGERMLLFSLDGGFSWISTSVSTLTYQYLDAVIATNDPSAVMSDENGSVTLINGLQPTLKQTRTPIYGRKIRDVSISNGYIIAAVDSVGVMYSTDNGETWATGKKGLSKIMVTARKGGGVLMLLPSLVDGLTKDDKWLAGYIGQSGVSATNSFEMSAKVVEHYSRLELPFNTGSYNDVYEVTYTCAPNDRGVHVVHVFYAKEYGPILFQRYIGDHLFDQSYLVKK